MHPVHGVRGRLVCRQVPSLANQIVLGHVQVFRGHGDVQRGAAVRHSWAEKGVFCLLSLSFVSFVFNVCLFFLFFGAGGYVLVRLFALAKVYAF